MPKVLPRPRLGELLAGFAAVPPAMEREVASVSLDSRSVEPGGLFLARVGTTRSGTEFIRDAVGRGACAVALEGDSGQTPYLLTEAGRTVPVLPVRQLGMVAGIIAARFHREPSRELSIIGVTGTNGKTSVSQFIAQMLVGDGPCGVVGTLGSGLLPELRDLGHTTPDAVTLQGELRAFRDGGADRAVMEVSSHALDQHRVAGVLFDTAVFTNLSRDHLDYHGDMESYAAAKGRLLEWPGVRHVVVNLDDPQGRQWWDTERAAETIGYSLRDPDPADQGRKVVYGREVILEREGVRLVLESPWGRTQLRAGLLGRFNVSNLLATCTAALCAGVPLGALPQRVAALKTVPGRMECFTRPGRPLAVVDYAHSPDALEKVLLALREHCGGGRLWCVFGCGGERDRGKRPLMGGIAERFADHVVVTDDNPRGEESRAIIEDIMNGITKPGAVVIPDRAEAIGYALRSAHPQDVVLVAGKGHEDYQLVGQERRSFSDRAVVARLLEGADG